SPSPARPVRAPRRGPVRRSPGPAANAQMSALCGRRPPHAVDLEGGADTLYARSAMSPERAHAPAAPAAGPSLTVVGASGLRAADSNGSSDPYCTCKLQGDNHRLFKTNIVRRSLNPTWNFFYALPERIAPPRPARRRRRAIRSAPSSTHHAASVRRHRACTSFRFSDQAFVETYVQQ
ncbi:unnamed protein product, partial [Prorocentrum cordatum]